MNRLGTSSIYAYESKIPFQQKKVRNILFTKKIGFATFSGLIKCKPPTTNSVLISKKPRLYNSWQKALHATTDRDKNTDHFSACFDMANLPLANRGHDTC